MNFAIVHLQIFTFDLRSMSLKDFHPERFYWVILLSVSCMFKNALCLFNHILVFVHLVYSDISCASCFKDPRESACIMSKLWYYLALFLQIVPFHHCIFYCSKKSRLLLFFSSVSIKHSILFFISFDSFVALYNYLAFPVLTSYC